MKNLQQWQNLWQQGSEEQFTQFANQQQEIMQQMAQKWQDFLSNPHTMTEENPSENHDFRQPEQIAPISQNPIALSPNTENTDNAHAENATSLPETTPIECADENLTSTDNLHSQNTFNQPESPQHTENPMSPAKNIMPLPNARKGEFYEAQLPTHATHVRIVPECGLTWDETKQLIQGIPTQTGDVEITYYLQHNNTIVPIRQTFYINADPKDLWHNIPTDTTIRFYKPDAQNESAKTPFGQLIAACVRGRSHAHTGKPCDDDYAIRYHTRTQLHFIAVSDGAGSAEYSRLGSQVAVDAAADKVWELLDSQQPNFSILPNQDEKNYKSILVNLVNAAAHQAFMALHSVAQEEKIEIKQLSCTLLFILALPITDKQWICAQYSVGDGALAIWQPENQHLHFIADSDSGSYSGETRFLSKEDVSSEQLKKRTRTTAINQSAPVLMLMTDGVSDPKFETDAQLKNPQMWAKLWAELHDVLQHATPEYALQEWLNFWSAGNHDDRTLAMFVPQHFFRLPETPPAHPEITEESTS